MTDTTPLVEEITELLNEAFDPWKVRPAAVLGDGPGCIEEPNPTLVLLDYCATATGMVGLGVRGGTPSPTSEATVSYAIQCVSCDYTTNDLGLAFAHEAVQQVEDPDHGGWDIIEVDREGQPVPQFDPEYDPIAAPDGLHQV